MNDKPKCNLCKENESIGVASSSLAACSLAMCSQCLKEGIEPWEFILYTWSGFPKEQYEGWFIELVERNLPFYGKTWDDLDRESRQQHEEYNEHLKREAEREANDIREDEAERESSGSVVVEASVKEEGV